MKQKAGARTGPQAEKGTSLLEVTIAMGLLLILMVGIIQMFSASLLVNGSAGARTEMTYKAQQVVEQLHFLCALQKNNQAQYNALYATPGGTTPAGIAIPLMAGTSFNVTDHVRLNEATSFWGPAGCGLVTRPPTNQSGAFMVPYILTVTVNAGNGTSLFATVRAQANPKPGWTGYDANYSNYKSLGLRKKVVEYVEQIN